MKKYTLGFLAGLAFSLLVFVPLLIIEQERKMELGRENGKIDGLWQSANELEKEFGVANSNQEQRILYTVKASSIVAVEIGGVNTVRVDR